MPFLNEDSKGQPEKTMTRAPQWPDPGDFWFRRFLETELPGLASGELTSLEKAHVLRGWVCRGTPRAPLNAGMHLSDDADFGFYSKGPSDLYKAFGEYFGGVMCHGIAYALMKVYELFGFHAFIYNLGFEDSHITHAVVVVTVDGTEGPLAIVEDPYYNLTINKDDGTPMDFFNMLELLRQRHHAKMAIDFDDNGEHDYIAPKEISAEERKLCGDLGKGVRELGDGRIVFRRFIPLSQWVRRQNIETALQAQGFPGSVLYLFCLPQGVFAGGGAETEEAKAMRDRITNTLDKKRA